MANLLVGAGTVGSPAESLEAALALTTEQAVTYYKYSGLWQPARIGLAYLMFFAIFDLATEAHSRVEALELDMPYPWPHRAANLATGDGSATARALATFDTWLATTQSAASWPNLTFVAADGMMREFRKDRCFVTGMTYMAQHADSSGEIQRIAKATVEMQFLFEPNSDVMRGVHVATNEGFVLDTFMDGYWSVKGPAHFCISSMGVCAAAGVAPYPSVESCVADVSASCPSHCH